MAVLANALATLAGSKSGAHFFEKFIWFGILSQQVDQSVTYIHDSGVTAGAAVIVSY